MGSVKQNAYPEENEKFFHFIASWRDKSQYSKNVRNLLTFCIINSLEKCSYTSKSGEYLGWDCRSKKVMDINKLRAEKGQKPLTPKFVRNVILDAKETILKELKHVLADIEIIQNDTNDKQDAKIEFILASALYITLAVKYRRILHRINFHLQGGRMRCSKGYND